MAIIDARPPAPPSPLEFARVFAPAYARVAFGIAPLVLGGEAYYYAHGSALWLRALSCGALYFGAYVSARLLGWDRADAPGERRSTHPRAIATRAGPSRA